MRHLLNRSRLLKFLRSRLAWGRGEVGGQSHPAERLWQEEFANLRLRLERLGSDFEKTTFLREYTGSLIAIGRPDDRAVRRFRCGGFGSLDLSKIYPALKSHELPAECGLTSLFYVKLLCSLGYQAYQYSFGFLEKPYERLVHSVGLVEIDFRGARRLIIQDPYWNLSYSDEKGDPIDFLAFLACLKRRQYHQVAAAMSSVTTGLVIDDASVYPALNDACKAAIAGAFTNSDGSRKAEIPIVRNYATLMQSPYHPVETAFVDALRRHGFPEPFLFTYTFRAAAIAGGRGRGELQRRIDAILR
jgi:hypothetical protein